MDFDMKKQKQQYLRRNIIQAGYDANRFTEYCAARRSADIDAWTWEELQELVDGFLEAEGGTRDRTSTDSYDDRRSSYSNKGYVSPVYNDEWENRNRADSLSGRYSDDFRATTFQEKRASLRQSVVSEQSDITIPVSTAEALAYEAPKYDIIVTDPEQHGTKFSLSQHVDYLVRTVTPGGVKWEVRRRYKDFEWLRTTLVAFHPGFTVPPLPKKKSVGRFDAAFIAKRQRALQRFLNRLAAVPVLARSPYLQAFLQSDDKFEGTKKTLDRAKKPTRISELASYVRQTELPNPPLNIEEASKALFDYRNSMEQHFVKLRDGGKTVSKSFQIVSETVDSMQESLLALHAQNTKQPQLAELFHSTREYFARWADLSSQQCESSALLLEDVFKFEIHDLETFREAFKRKDDMYSDWRKAESSLSTKKEKLWKTGDVSKWGVVRANAPVSVAGWTKYDAFSAMLPEETKGVDEMKLLCEFMSRQIFYDMQKDYEAKPQEFKQALIKFAKSELALATQMQTMWSDYLYTITGGETPRLAAESRRQSRRETVGTY
eukprot:GILJ01003456.1.p1 GENE.GILJ01003456.1~~GILJ01003456.1.p1  ORF type:complete len:548 (-),score=87.56 GILJ01003456.1:187-1830(-)